MPCSWGGRLPPPASSPSTSLSALCPGLNGAEGKGRTPPVALSQLGQGSSTIVIRINNVAKLPEKLSVFGWINKSSIFWIKEVPAISIRGSLTAIFKHVKDSDAVKRCLAFLGAPQRPEQELLGDTSEPQRNSAHHVRFWQPLLFETTWLTNTTNTRCKSEGDPEREGIRGTA